MKMKRRRRKGLSVLLLAAALGGAAVALAEDLYVQHESLDVMDTPGSTGKVVETVKKDAKLQVLERTVDGFVRVKLPDGKEGFVPEDSVGKEQGFKFDLHALDANSQAKLDTAAATRGLERETEDYASAEHYDKTELKRAITLNADPTVSGASLEQFQKDGKLLQFRGH